MQAGPLGGKMKYRSNRTRWGGKGGEGHQPANVPETEWEALGGLGMSPKGDSQSEKENDGGGISDVLLRGAKSGTS